MLIALLGHSLTQLSHAVHFSLLTSAGIRQPFQRTTSNHCTEKDGIITDVGEISIEISKSRAKVFCRNPLFQRLKHVNLSLGAPRRCTSPAGSRFAESRQSRPPCHMSGTTSG
jgi:hypothetical protein